MAPKTETPLKHIEFVHLNPGRALVVIVTAEGIVENRIIEVPRDIHPSVFVEATNFLNQRLVGQTIGDARNAILEELGQKKAALDQLTRKIVRSWACDMVRRGRGRHAHRKRPSQSSGRRFCSYRPRTHPHSF